VSVYLKQKDTDDLKCRTYKLSILIDHKKKRKILFL